MKKHLVDIDKKIKTFSIQDWKEFLSSELAFVFTTKTYNVNPNILYRGRLNKDGNNKPIDFFHHVDELWAPPAEFVGRNGRCNVKGQSILYCSTSPTINLFELKPNIGEELTFIDYDILGNIENLALLNYKDVVLLGDDYRAIFGQHLHTSSKETEELDDIISNVFKLSHTEQYPIYNLTNAIFQIFTDDPRNDLVPDFLKPPKNNGLIYPSVTTDVLLGVNLALDPESVKKIFKPFAAYKLKVLDKLDDHRYKMIQTHITENINPSGEITWIENKNAFPELITDLPIKNNAP